MKTVILPTDGSANAEHAMRYALQLQSGETTTFIIFQSIDISAYGADVPLTFSVLDAQEMERNLLDRVAPLLAEFSKQPFTFEAKVAFGGVAPCIDELTEQRKIDLIVMGTKGATGLEGAIFGSVSAEVVSTTTCPVIVVPQQAELKLPKTILFAIDNKGLSSSEIAEPMLNLAKQTKAQLHLLHVLDEGHVINVKEAIAGLQMEHLLAEIPHDYLFLSNADKALAIEQHVQANAVDLVVTVPRRNNFFDAIFHRSVTRKLAMHVKVPILVMHDLG